jgi:predicted phosphodiesterase
MGTASVDQTSRDTVPLDDLGPELRLELTEPFAVLSDVHGNLPGLEAVLRDADARGLKTVLSLGDLVGYGPHPDEVVTLLAERGIPSLMGNYDQGIGFSLGDCGCVYKTDEQRAQGAASLAWTDRRVSEETRALLRALYGRFVIETPAGTLLAVHASPRRINEYVFADRPEHTLARLAAGAEERLGSQLRAIVFGHTHVPYVRDVTVGPDGRTVTFVNDGSAGRPRDGDWRVCYAAVDPGVGELGMLRVEFVRVSWDRDRLMRDLAATTLITTYDAPGTAAPNAAAEDAGSAAAEDAGSAAAPAEAVAGPADAAAGRRADVEREAGDQAGAGGDQ